MTAPMERIQSLDLIEKDIVTCLQNAGQAMLELSKEKTSLKQAESHTHNFLKTLSNVELKLMDQINYLTQVSTGQPHEGSGYASQKVLQMAWHRLEHARSRINELERIKNKHLQDILKQQQQQQQQQLQQQQLQQQLQQQQLQEQQQQLQQLQQASQPQSSQQQPLQQSTSQQQPQQSQQQMTQSQLQQQPSQQSQQLPSTLQPQQPLQSPMQQQQPQQTPQMSTSSQQPQMANQGFHNYP